MSHRPLALGEVSNTLYATAPTTATGRPLFRVPTAGSVHE